MPAIHGDSDLTRREFIGRAGCLAAGGAAFMSTFTRLQLLQAATPPGGSTEDYRALVCLFMFGGNDSWNLVVPTSGTNYQSYADARQSLAIPQGNLLPITPKTAQADPYGFHPSCPELKDLFESDKLAIMANTGPLLFPTTRDQYQSGSVELPPQLFSHNTQQKHWQTSLPQDRNRIGWAGRVADLLNTTDPNGRVPMNISINGGNILQTGSTTLPYSVSSRGVPSFRGLNSDSTQNQLRLDSYLKLINRGAGHVMAVEFSDIARNALENSQVISDELDNLADFTTVFPNSSLGNQLRTVAKLMAVRSTLQVTRQIFFVGTGGFDTHGGQNNKQPNLLSNISQSMDAFYKVTEELGLQDNVVTFTMTDFGRTLTSNGDGSDHGWGGHSMVMGSCVNGRDIYGTMPTLELGGPDDTRGGRLIPTTSVDQYGATLAKWYGVPDGSLDIAFPNLSRFPTRDLGFMLP